MPGNGEATLERLFRPHPHDAAYEVGDGLFSDDDCLFGVTNDGDATVLRLRLGNIDLASGCLLDGLDQGFRQSGLTDNELASLGLH